MTAGLTELSLCLHGSPPYGFRIAGGDGEAVIVARVRNGSKAEQTGLKEADVVLAVNGVLCKNLSYDSIFGLTEYDDDQLSLIILRGAGNVHKWKEASGRLVGEMKLLSEEQVKDMLKFKTKQFGKFERPIEKQIFQLQMPKKKSIVSSSPVSFMIDGSDMKMERGSSEIVHVPLKIQEGQRVFVREINQPEMVQRKESYSFSSTKDFPFSKEEFHTANTIPKITHTFVSQNNFRLGDSISEKIDSALNSALNSSIFFDSSPQLIHQQTNLQKDFQSDSQHVSKNSNKPNLHNNFGKALEQGEYLIAVKQEPQNKFQSVAKFDLNQQESSEEKYISPHRTTEETYPSPNRTTENKYTTSQTPTEGYLVKQNITPVKKTQEEVVGFPSTKIFSDYLPKSSLDYQPMFKPDWQDEPSHLPHTKFPVMNFSSDFQNQKEVGEKTTSDVVFSSYTAPSMKPKEISQNVYQQFPYQPVKPSEAVPKAPPIPQINNFHSGESKAPRSEKEAMNSKVALAKNVANSVLSEANQHSKGQKMFLARRQKSDKWTVQGPDPPKQPIPTTHQADLSKSAFNTNQQQSNSNNTSMDRSFEGNNHTIAPSNLDQQSFSQSSHYHPSYPSQSQSNQYLPSTFSQPPSLEASCQPQSAQQSWPQYQHPSSFSQQNGHAPINAYPYQPSHPHQFYPPYQQTQQPYYPSHPHEPYYSSFPQNQHVNLFQPHHQPTQLHIQPTQLYHQPTPLNPQPTYPYHSPNQYPYQPTPPNHQPNNFTYQPAPLNHQPIPPNHQPTQPNHQPTQPNYQPAPPNHQPTQPNYQPNYQPALPNHQPSPAYHQPASLNHQLTPLNHQNPNDFNYQPTKPSYLQAHHPPSHLTQPHNQPHNQPPTHLPSSQEFVDFCDL